MDLDTSPRVLGAAGAGARLSKRKTMGDDRYEPYNDVLSPHELGSSLGTTPRTSVSPQPPPQQQRRQTPHSTQYLYRCGRRRRTQLALSCHLLPSAGVLYRNIQPHHYATYASRYSTSTTISRPINPSINNTGDRYGLLLPAATGSGPGYGSGALGLSISANNTQSLESRMQLERQEEMRR